MAMVFTPDKKGSGASPIALAGGVWLLFGTLTISGSYATGGDSLDLTKFVPAMGAVRAVVPISNVRGYTAEYDVTNKKLKLWVPNSTGPAVAEHGAAAYDSDLTGSVVPVAFLLK